DGPKPTCAAAVHHCWTRAPRCKSSRPRSGRTCNGTSRQYSAGVARAASESGLELPDARRVEGEELWDRHSCVATLPELGQDAKLERLDRLPAVLVHPDDRARMQSRADVVGDPEPVGSLRVAAGEVPDDLQEPEPACFVVDDLVACAVRGSEQEHRC